MTLLFTNSILGVALVGVANGTLCFIAERVSRKWREHRILNANSRRIDTEKARLQMMKRSVQSTAQKRA